MEAISFRDVSFSYAGCEKKALKEINLDIHPSGFTVICGKSGCGKSTLLRQLKKNLAPYGKLEGKVFYYGKEIQSLKDRESTVEIGFVQQNPDNQIVTDKVWHELAFGLESLGCDNATMKRKVAEMASFFGMQTWFQKHISELSGGQKQLLNLASIMVMQPKVLILDEPTAQLDPIAASDFLATLQKINRELGTAILISEHRLEEIFPMVDRVVVMEEGRILIHDTPKKTAQFLTAGEKQNPMFYGLPSVAKIFSLLKGEGECPLSVREGRLWLESLLETAKKTEGFREARLRRGKDSQGKGLWEAKKSGEKEIAIRIRDVWFRYRRDGTDILKGVNLEVEKGQWACILGGNGVGKSTTLKAVAGLIQPYRGYAEVNGIRVEKKNQKRLFHKCLSMLPQNPQAVFTEITAEEELLEALYQWPLSDTEKVQKVEDMLELMELTELRKSHPYDLSGGEQQRLALGKILLLEPEILLLDEPTKGLDPFFKRKLAEILQKLQQQGVTIFMVSHDLEFCAEYADRCALYFDGEIVGMDTPVEFFSGNSFYTTAANRMARQWFPEAVTCEEVARRCEEAMM